MPKYLLKFIKKSYLDSFLFDGLYMNAAGYFSAMGYENNGGNMGDKYECLSNFPYIELPQNEKTQAERYAEAKTQFDRMCAAAPIIGYNVYIGRNRPIWCCSIVNDSDIEDGSFKFDKRIVKDFFPESTQDAYAVLIDYDRFIKHIHNNPDKYTIRYAEVCYHNIFNEFGSEGSNSIFYKNVDLNYQREFRIVILRRCRMYERSIIKNEIKTHILSPKTPYKAYFYKLPNINSMVVRKYTIDSLKQDDNYIYFSLTED